MIINIFTNYIDYIYVYIYNYYVRLIKFDFQRSALMMDLKVANKTIVQYNLINKCQSLNKFLKIDKIKYAQYWYQKYFGEKTGVFNSNVCQQLVIRKDNNSDYGKRFVKTISNIVEHLVITLLGLDVNTFEEASREIEKRLASINEKLRAETEQNKVLQERHESAFRVANMAFDRMAERQKTYGEGHLLHRAAAGTYAECKNTRQGVDAELSINNDNLYNLKYDQELLTGQKKALINLNKPYCGIDINNNMFFQWQALDKKKYDECCGELVDTLLATLALRSRNWKWQ